MTINVQQLLLPALGPDKTGSINSHSLNGTKLMGPTDELRTIDGFEGEESPCSIKPTVVHWRALDPPSNERYCLYFVGHRRN